jgi:phosphate starvation-inducible PhoH-like protein
MTTKTASSTIVVPSSISMVSILGARDEILHAIEKAIPNVDILVRGNEIQIDGPTAEVALVDQLLAEVQIIVRTGATMSPDAAIRSIELLRSENEMRPAKF